MISPYSSHHSGPCSVTNPSSPRRAIRRITGSLSAGDSIGFSALSSCIFFDETDQVVEFKRFAHVVVSAADARLLGDVAVARHDDVWDVLRIRIRLERTAKLLAAHAFDGEIREDHGRLRGLRAIECALSIRDDL